MASILHSIAPACRTSAVCTGVLTSLLAMTVATGVSAQSYNPYIGAMNPQAAPRMAVATTASNTLAPGKQISGIAEVTGPGMLSILGRDLRLHGIIIPLERATQTKASADLIRLTKGAPVDCVTVGTDSDGITLAACGTELYPNLALALLDGGRALVDRQQVAGTPVADLYLDAERQARRADLGLWGNETGPIPTHVAGTARQFAPSDLAPSTLTPPPPKPVAYNAPAVSGGPIIRFDDGSSLDLTNMGAVPMAAAPDRARFTQNNTNASFIPPDMPISGGFNGIGQQAFDAANFNTLGLRALPDSQSNGLIAAQPQLASLDGTIELPRTLPSFEPTAPARDTGQNHNSMLLGLIGHLDEIVQRHRNAKERGELYLPTPPGEAPRTVDLSVSEPTAPATGGLSFIWGIVMLGLLSALGVGAAYAYRWHQGIWPWERSNAHNGLSDAWTQRQRRALSIAQSINQEALNLSFALSERADIARLAANNQSGRTASDLRALRIEAPSFIGDNWHDISRFSRSIGLQARMLHTQIAEFDRRVADQAALATEGRLHSSTDKVFSALGKRLEELSQAAKQLHINVKSRSQTPSLKRQTQRVETQRDATQRIVNPRQNAGRATTNRQNAGWAAVAQA